MRLSMKHGIIIISLLLGFGFQMKAQTTKTVGTGGDYTTLAAAFTAINNGQVTGNIVLQLISNTTEPATDAKLNKSGSGSASYTAVLIYPTADNIEIAGKILLNGANYVTINGSKNATGTVKNLIIANKVDGSKLHWNCIVHHIIPLKTSHLKAVSQTPALVLCI